MGIVGELDPDVMDCGDPEAALEEMVKHLRWRAGNSRALAEHRASDAKDAEQDAVLFAVQAAEFEALADALQRAPVTFAASADTQPKAGDVKQAEGGDAE